MTATVPGRPTNEGIQIKFRPGNYRPERKSAESVFRPLTRLTAQNFEEKTMRPLNSTPLLKTYASPDPTAMKQSFSYRGFAVRGVLA